MNSRERVRCTFEHEEPDRIPFWCGASVEFWDKAKRELGLDDEGLRIRLRDDFRRVRAVFHEPGVQASNNLKIRTVFGIERAGEGWGQPISHPLKDADLKEVMDYPWPDPAWMDVSQIKPDAQSYHGQYAILGGDWSPFWHDAIDLIGMENLYIKMYSEPDLVDTILKHIVDYYFEVNKRIFDASADVIDIFFMGNDFGSQTGPLMSPDMFDRFMAPHLKRLCDLGHSYGLKNQLHCCGGIYELIPGMIDAGIDALHAVQVSCRGMDLATLKSEFGKKIVFNGGIDSHHVLIEGDTDFVREKTREVLNIMSPGGGFIAGASHDTILEETPLENVLAMTDEIIAFDFQNNRE